MAKKKRNSSLRNMKDNRKRKSMSDGKNWIKRLLEPKEDEQEQKKKRKRSNKDGAKRLRGDHL
ncbi:hypothetical protein ACFOZ1_07950 [Gracilibacillus marinus]|uniref:Uncharacterized protein n=1 Tax=Gracilibacillus marinus TaxID=630535 RepID=A0ABV8VXF7_9BACI